MRSTRFSLFLALMVSLAGACGGDEPGEFATKRPHAPRDAGNDEPTKDAGTAAGEGGSSGKGAGSGGSSAGSGGSSAGSGGSNAGSGGSSAGSGGSGEMTVDLPDSPANPWIAFVTIDGSGFGQLWFVKADGTGLAEYSGTTFYENDPAWSPDGKKLAFMAMNETSGATELHILDFTSNDDSVLDTGLAGQTRPRWVADGSKIIVAGSADGTSKSALYSVDVASGDSVAMTEPVEGDGGHDVSPDGTVYFVRKLSVSAFDVFFVPFGAKPADTATRVTDGSNIIGGVAVHPAGTKLLFAKKSAMSTQLVEHTMAGGSERMIGEVGDEQADYFAGGDGIVVNRDSFDADSEIAIGDKDGTLMKKCTDDPQSNTSPTIASIESSEVDISMFVQ